MQPTPVFLTGKLNGQRSLVGYSPWGHRELDVTEQLSMHSEVLSLLYFSKATELRFRFFNVYF